MELDELKESWEKIGSSEKVLQREAIQQLLKHDSKSPMVKLRKSMLIELVIFILSISFLYAIYFSNAFNNSNLAFLGLGIFSAIWILSTMFFYSNVYKKTRKVIFSGTVVEELKLNIESLKNDINYYRNLNLIMYLPAIFIGLVLGDKTFNNITELMNVEYKFLLFCLLVSVLFFPLYYLFVKLWVNIFYLRYINNLEELLNELQTT